MQKLTRRGFMGLAASSLAGCGAASAQAPTTPAAAPAGTVAAPTATPRTVPGWQQLFGPVQGQAALGADGLVLPSVWHFPGSALTPSTKLWRFDMNMAPIPWAIWRICWTTENTVQKARLVHFADGPTDIQVIAEITGKGGGLYVADNQNVQIGPALNALRGGPYRNIGMQLYGDGASQFRMWESRIEFVMEV